MIVLFFSFKEPIKFQRARRARGSMPTVGSSKKSICGSLIKATNIFSFLNIPPLYPLAFRLIPSNFNRFRSFFMRSLICSLVMRCNFPKYSIFSLPLRNLYTVGSCGHTPINSLALLNFFLMS